jgi:hypothetical protein
MKNDVADIYVLRLDLWRGMDAINCAELEVAIGSMAGTGSLKRCL